MYDHVDRILLDRVLAKGLGSSGDCDLEMCEIGQVFYPRQQKA